MHSSRVITIGLSMINPTLKYLLIFYGAVPKFHPFVLFVPSNIARTEIDAHNYAYCCNPTRSNIFVSVFNKSLSVVIAIFIFNLKLV